MILIRDVFRVRFGRMRELKAVWNEGKPLFEEHTPAAGSFRVLTDLTGPAYTFVLEITYQSLADYEKSLAEIFSREQWQQWYAKVVPLVESSNREIYTILE